MRILSVGIVRASEDSCNNAAECQEVLENLRDAVFNPLIHSAMPREATVALLCSFY